MENFRTTFFNLVFLWLGIVVTKGTLDGTPRGDWTSEVTKLGLILTMVVVLVSLADVAIRRAMNRRRQAPVKALDPNSGG